MDARLRELQRSWLASGSPDDERRYLRERQRTGAIRWDTIEMAAFAGDPVAGSLLGEDVYAYEPPEGLIKFLRGLPQSDEALLARIAFACVEVALAELGSPADMTEALGLARAWRDDPAPVNAAAARERYQTLVASAPELGQGAPGRAQAGGAAQACLRAAGALLAGAAGLRPPAGLEEPHDGTPVESCWRWAANSIAEAGFPAPALRRIRAAVSAALLPWVLTRDEPPVEDRWAQTEADLLHRASERFAEGSDELRRHLEWLVACRANVLRVAELRQAQRLARQFPGPERLFAPGDELGAEEARAILDALGGRVPRRLEAAQASAVIEAYHLARGWKRVRGHLLAPSGQRRIVLKARVLRVEEGGPGHWKKNPTTELREISLLRVAQALLDALTAQGGGPGPSSARG